MWFVFALCSALFAALTSILAKVGIEGVNSTLATAIRTVVVLAMSWGMVFLTRAQGGMGEISRRSWLFLILSGLATGASWMCYYRALQLGRASQVVPIDRLSVVITLVLAFVFLHEPFTAKSMVGCALIAAGTLFMVLEGGKLPANNKALPGKTGRAFSFCCTLTFRRASPEQRALPNGGTWPAYPAPASARC